MSGAIEAAGDIATGAAWAHAVEPATADARGEAGHGPCLNCGTALIGRYCHGCGQSAHVHKTLMSIVHDLLHGVFHFEGRIWRTMPMLVRHPGALTRRYIDGERAKFVSPLALFLFTVFLMFAAFSSLGPTSMGSGIVDGLTDASVQIDRAKDQTERLLAAAVQERAERVAAHQDTRRIDARIASLRGDARTMAALGGRLDASRDGQVRVHSSFGWLDEGLQRARENPGLVLYKMQSAAYKYSWALIFLSTPLVALMFLWRRRFGLYDHATFVTYSLSFMSLLVVVAEVAAGIGLPTALVATAITLIPPMHMFAQLRGTYGLGVFGALWRTALLLAFAAVALLFFVMGVVALEVAR